MSKPVVAICYDFDMTLSNDYMQSFGFISKLGMTSDEFWKTANENGKKKGIDSTLTYLLSMIEETKKCNIKLTRKFLNECGKNIKFFDGVTSWFKRINEYADFLGIKLEHYVISTGNKEIMEGSPIFKEFKNVYACEFLYDEKGEAYWLKTFVNYTLKTQCLFRICKGLSDADGDSKVNERVDKKRVEFRNMIYVGDGFTDVPCMALVKEKGGVSIAVYDKNQEVSNELVKQNRVNYACKADYRAGSPLENLMKLVLDSISLKEKLLKRESK